jgi:hypothetical protein
VGVGDCVVDRGGLDAEDECGGIQQPCRCNDIFMGKLDLCFDDLGVGYPASLLARRAGSLWWWVHNATTGEPDCGGLFPFLRAIVTVIYAERTTDEAGCTDSKGVSSYAS